MEEKEPRVGCPVRAFAYGADVTRRGGTSITQARHFQARLIGLPLEVDPWFAHRDLSPLIKPKVMNCILHA